MEIIHDAEKQKEYDTVAPRGTPSSRLNVIRIAAYILSAVVLVFFGLELFKMRQSRNREQAHVWNQIGYCYLHGQSNTTDIVALTWFEEIKDRKDILDDPLVKSHCKGVQFGQLAAKYFSIAADLGLSDAQFNLGRLYRGGNGVSKSSKKAMKWFRKAAKQGHVAAQFNLGLRYSQGRHVVKSDAEAIYWYEKAAMQGLIKAQYNLAMIYIDEHSIKQDYEKGLEILRSLAESDAHSQNALGLCYFNGYGVDQDYRLALQWYSKAAKQGLGIAEYNIGVMFIHGYGVKQDLKEAAAWIYKAAMKNEAIAVESMGDLYYEGWGVQKNTEEARHWWWRAAQAGSIQAKERLGRYEKTENVEE